MRREGGHDRRLTGDGGHHADAHPDCAAGGEVASIVSRGKTYHGEQRPADEVAKTACGNHRAHANHASDKEPRTEVDMAHE